MAAVRAFLEGINLQVYADAIIDDGFDDLDTLEQVVMEDHEDLKSIVSKAGHRAKMRGAFQKLAQAPASVPLPAAVANPTPSDNGASVAKRMLDAHEQLAGQHAGPISGLKTLPIVTLEDAVKELEPHCDNIRANAWQAKRQIEDELPSEEDRLGASVEGAAAINLYTRGWLPFALFSILNNLLRKEDRRQLQPFFLYLKLILDTLNKLPPFDREVWRGVKEDLSDKYTKGQKLFWWAFSSCTIDMDVLQDDTFLGKTGPRTLFRIKTKSARRIDRFSYFKKEVEILMMPGVFLEVVNIIDLGGGLTLIELEEQEPPFPMTDFAYADGQLPQSAPLPNVEAGESVTAALPPQQLAPVAKAAAAPTLAPKQGQPTLGSVGAYGGTRRGSRAHRHRILYRALRGETN